MQVSTFAHGRQDDTVYLINCSGDRDQLDL